MRWTADTDIFFLLKSDVPIGGVISQFIGHAKRLAECNVVRFFTQKKHIGISLRQSYLVIQEKKNVKHAQDDAGMLFWRIKILTVAFGRS